MREALVWKLDGLSEYDVRRPLTVTGTNLLGLVKHNAIGTPVTSARCSSARSPSRCLRGTMTTRPALTCGRRSAKPRRHHRPVPPLWSHTDATIGELPLDARGYVPWWDEEVPLFNVMVHCLSDTTRHAGRHADILRGLGLDGAVGVDPRGARAAPGPRRVSGRCGATPSSVPLAPPTVPIPDETLSAEARHPGGTARFTARSTR